MTTTTDPDPIEQPGRPRLDQLRRRLVQLRRRLVHRVHVRPATPSREAGHPAVPRVWREVAPGEWRWLHLPDETVPK